MSVPIIRSVFLVMHAPRFWGLCRGPRPLRYQRLLVRSVRRSSEYLAHATTSNNNLQESAPLLASRPASLSFKVDGKIGPPTYHRRLRSQDSDATATTARPRRTTMIVPLACSVSLLIWNQTRKSPSPVPPIPDFAGKRGGNPRFPAGPESGNRESPILDSAGNGPGNRGPDWPGRKSGNRGCPSV